MSDNKIISIIHISASFTEICENKIKFKLICKLHHCKNTGRNIPTKQKSTHRKT